MATGNKAALKARFKSILSNSDNPQSIDTVAGALADAVEQYIDSLTITVPAGEVVVAATGGVNNPNPIECDK